jgi:glutamate synthase domain-containing protein 2
VKKSTLGIAPLAAIAAVGAHDLLQRRHALLRNFPVIGHARYWLEAIGPELRQYIVAGNDEERPFSRDQRRWVYASSKLENNYFGFGTDNDLEHTTGNVIVHHRTFPRTVATPGHPGQEGVAAVCEGARWSTGTPARVPPQLGRQCLRHELRLAVRARDRGAEPRSGDRRLHAEHG